MVSTRFAERHSMDNQYTNGSMILLVVSSWIIFEKYAVILLSKSAKRQRL
jgi:hypothetical protein